ncbi:MAG: hypothetical protein SLAVMIC_00314 [uncultured marine phage]|uniref:Uncharacterized protein n=1 Tax=uncultured marine phage TaxID=707152 RepID=A0A8D9FRF7_9VIRU|nr:MAG: hypothetical protein SLAVMIC_00314 [uncultured marine phage]
MVKKIKVPKGCYYNAHITNGYLYADTNSSTNWEKCKILLPDGIWKLKSGSHQLITIDPISKKSTHDAIIIELDVVATREQRLNKILNDKEDEK